MLKFEKERINLFRYILYISFFGKFYQLTYYLLTNIKRICLKLKKIFQKFAKKKNFRIFAAKIGTLSDK